MMPCPNFRKRSSKTMADFECSLLGGPIEKREDRILRWIDLHWALFNRGATTRELRLMTCIPRQGPQGVHHIARRLEAAGKIYIHRQEGYLPNLLIPIAEIDHVEE